VIGLVGLTAAGHPVYQIISCSGTAKTFTQSACAIKIAASSSYLETNAGSVGDVFDFHINCQIGLFAL